MNPVCGVSRLMVVTSFVCGAMAYGTPPGDYAGWVYAPDGSDFPLRMHLRADPDLTVTIDSPAQRAWGLASSRCEDSDKGLSFERVSSSGRRWRYDLRWDGRSLQGHATLDDNSVFEVYLSPASASLPKPEPAWSAGFPGIYRGPGGRQIIITEWFWGEPRITDLRTGAERTLFATGPDTFVYGPAQYIPGPVVGRLTLRRGADASVTAIEESSDGPPVVLVRQNIIETPVSFTNGEVVLHGTVRMLDTPGLHPAVVMLGGSNWRVAADVRRDADGFAAMGLAVLSFDHRGNGESTGSAVCSLEDIGRDGAAAIEFLSTVPGIDPARIGVCGRSRGGWTAPVAATLSARTAFAILLVPASVPPAVQETTRRMQAIRESGATPAQLEDARSYLASMFQSTRSDADWDAYTRLLETHREAPWLAVAGVMEGRESEDYAWDALNMWHDPLPVLSRLRCPVLAIFGGKDTNVTPAQNVPPMVKALIEGGNGDFTVTVLPEATHGLFPAAAAGRITRIHEGSGVVRPFWMTIQTWLETRGLSEPSPTQ